MNAGDIQTQEGIYIQNTDRGEKSQPGDKHKQIMLVHSKILNTQRDRIKCTHDMIYIIENELSRPCNPQTVDRPGE